MKKILLIVLLTVSVFYGQDSWRNLGPEIDNLSVYDIFVVSRDTILIAGYPGGFIITEDGGQNWDIRSDGLDLLLTDIELDNRGSIYVTGLEGLYKSTDYGNSWFTLENGLSGKEYFDIVFYDNILYTSNLNGLYYSTDYGNSWQQTDYTGCTTHIKRNKNYLFIGGPTLACGGFFRLDKYGDNWDYLPYTPNTFGLIGETELLIHNSESLYYSPDNGFNWSQVEYFNEDDCHVTHIIANKNGRVFCAVDRPDENRTGIYTTSDLFGEWLNLGLYGKNIQSLEVTEEGLYAGTDGEGLFLYTGSYTPVELAGFYCETEKEGAITLRWITATETNNRGFFIERSPGSDNFQEIGFLEGNGTTTEQQRYSFSDTPPPGTKYYYRLRQVDFDGSVNYSKTVEYEPGPGKFEVSQNYPNPFNGTTKINFILPAPSEVTLDLFDVTGRKIISLPAKKYSAGINEITLNADDLASGVYLYTLKVYGSDLLHSSRTLKMILLK